MRHFILLLVFLFELNLVGLSCAELLFRVDANALGLTCDNCTAAFAGRNPLDYGVRRDGDSSNYFVELSNTNGQDSQARVDVSGWTLPANSTRLSSSMWVRLTNFENMRVASRFITNQRESLTARNTSDRVFYMFVGPFQNTRSAFGNSVDLRVRMLVVNETTGRNFDLEARAFNRIMFPNRWHHLASTYNNGTLILYLDTAEVGRIVGAGCSRIVFPTGPMSIGAVAPGPVPPGYNATALGTIWDDSGVTGHMDDIRLYDQVLSRADIVAVYNGYDPNFTVPTNNAPAVLSMPPWLMDITTSNQSMYSNVYRHYIAPGNDTFWKVTASAVDAASYVRGNPFNETLAEVVAMPFVPSALKQGVSPINEYYLLFEHAFEAFPAKPTTLPGRQFAIGLAHNNTLINFNATSSKVPTVLCRTFTLGSFGGDSTYPTFQSWIQFDASQCRASNATSLVRMAIRFALPTDSMLDAVVYEFVSDPFEVILPKYQSFVLPFANTEIGTLPTSSSSSSSTSSSSFSSTFSPDSTVVNPIATLPTTATGTAVNLVEDSRGTGSGVDDSALTLGDAAIGGIIGGSVAGLVLLIGALIACVVLTARRRRQSAPAPSAKPMPIVQLDKASPVAPGAYDVVPQLDTASSTASDVYGSFPKTNYADHAHAAITGNTKSYASFTPGEIGGEWASARAEPL